ncbi:28S ribosomal protein S29, mitochondrial-like [Teleopsis dalmanni]|uniref:28S ribosomal protein S29, mitochondrial-like n=1 Tax=Teleopsis dalmanni TaxID=139649 RepID=UPI0018CFD3F5|nr:28S ribosomal protein S29, mitochondrial-like [Teleopsis dalmanni]XP_037939308.1 28S ribosomal protein S29, mitochondrial-like [Teleopsis dalmanni]
MFAVHLKKCLQYPKISKNMFCTVAALERNGIALVPTDYRTTQSKIDAHSDVHIGKFYTIPPEDKKQLFSGGGFPRKFEEQVKTFAESCLLVRSPALEIINYIKRSDLSRPTVRYVVYGDNGAGKTLTLAHVLHYGLQNDFLLVHVPWVPNWMKRPKEVSNIPEREGYVDLPFDAAAWLKHFKTQNSTLLPKLKLTTSKEYVWSKRETTPAGSSITELVEHGITRIKFASETIAALLSEIKQHATAGQCKVMVAIDGFNAFFHPETRILGDNKQIITPDRVSLTQPFVDIANYNWTNGVCIVTVDKIAMTEGYMDSYLPRYLLGKDGFECLDPFIPIHVGNYTEKEFASCINYYLDRHWIQKAPQGFDEQLKFLSNKNPYYLMHLTRSL